MGSHSTVIITVTIEAKNILKDIAPAIPMMLASLACFYLLTYNYVKSDKKNIARFIDLTIISSVIPLTVGAVQYIAGTGNHMTEGLNRINATFVHPNPFAYYLLIIIAACFISVYKREYNTGRRFIVIRVIILISAEIKARSA
jgi:hypothetical protein